ncbi:apolipoprotein N-acyltransferase [Dactylosporangium sp. NPDC005572]|uniref:apolipoprotein N-acyltransferase n=1 Tax=Dactylosporangium sp. NPDC005572 TaxID=3156889 RepID=UPI0033B7599F
MPFGLGALAGALFFTPLLSWTNLHTGAVPWLLLSGLETLYFGLVGAASAWTSPLLEKGRWARWAWVPLLAAVWTGQEALRDRTPFGGFPWGRLAFSQDESPLLRLAALGGAPLVTFAVALAGAFLAYGVIRGLTAGVKWRLGPGLVAAPVAAAVVVVAGWLVPLHAPTGPAVYVAVVQGNVPRLGLDFNAQRRAVLDNHANATIELAEKVNAGLARRPDLVVWPENSSDIDPLRNRDAAAVIDRAAHAIGAPILVGAVLSSAEKGVENVGLVWSPDQPVGAEIPQYTKRHPVPFAERMPLRGIARMVSKEVDRVTDMTAGTEPGVLTVGPAVVGDVICFEVAYDDIVRDTVDGGAQLLAVQTNNATFDESEARQQLAMVRLRAVEHGRDALMASTVGISAFADTRGGTQSETRFNEAAVILAELHLGTARTLATRLGVIPEFVIVVAALAGLAACAEVRRRDRRVHPNPTVGNKEDV